MAYRDQSERRFRAARSFFRLPQWDADALVEKANSLAVRLLALGVVYREHTRTALYPDELQQRLLALVGATEDVRSKKRKPKKRKPKKPKPGRRKQQHRRVRPVEHHAETARVDVQGDGQRDQ